MNNAKKDQHQRPEGKLIERAIKSRRGFSNRDLAKLVNLSEGRIRQIINGYRTEAGTVLEISAPVDTLVRIANALDITPAALSEAGREDAAEVLRSNPRVGIAEDGSLWLAGNAREHEAMRAWLDDPDGPPPASVLQLWTLEVLLEAAAKKHRDEVRLLNHMMDLVSKEGEQSDVPRIGPRATNEGGVHVDEAAYAPDEDE